MGHQRKSSSLQRKEKKPKAKRPGEVRGRDPSTDHLKALLLSQQSLNKAHSSRAASLTVKPALQK